MNSNITVGLGNWKKMFEKNSGEISEYFTENNKDFILH